MLSQNEPTCRYLTWEDVDNAARSVVNQMIRAEYEPTHIVGIGRGGLIPSAIVAYQYSLLVGASPMLITVYARSYTGKDETERGELQVAVNDLDTLLQLGPKVLVVDDIADSGATLMAFQQLLPEASFAVMYHKKTSEFTPTFHGPVDNEGTRNWYVFPWERRQYVS